MLIHVGGIYPRGSVQMLLSHLKELPAFIVQNVWRGETLKAVDSFGYGKQTRTPMFMKMNGYL